MPSAQDYLTVGHLYRAIADGLAAMVTRQGEERTFIGEREAQVGPDLVNLPGMCVVVDLKSALAAIEMIVDQGEGTRAGGADSHFARFAAIATEYDAFLARRSDFVPHRPVARNPVMRRPPQPLDKVFVEEAEAAGVLDLANAVYGLMLRCLAQGFGRSGPPGEKRLLLDTASDLMSAAVPLARVLTMLPATKRGAGLTAGITFAMLRSVARTPPGNGEWALISERLSELAVGAARIPQKDERVRQVAQALWQMAERFDRQSKKFIAQGRTPGAPMKSQEADKVVARQAPEPQIEGEVETIRGSALTLKFERKRCIHARFCVLGLPDVYRANVQGPWIDPDAVSLEANIGVAHNCPSGAIRYERHDGGPAEPAPKVNIVRLRENGPYAFNARLTLDGKFVGYRARFVAAVPRKTNPSATARTTPPALWRPANPRRLPSSRSRSGMANWRSDHSATGPWRFPAISKSSAGRGGPS